jgi:bifunctional DNA-binding transcriptional regulator/antitoxin component of YhaV-PrlF toxin-antitoxin module
VLISTIIIIGGEHTITKKTSTAMKTNKNTKALRTAIPALVRDTLKLQEKDIIIWNINDETKEIKVSKVE